MSPREQKRLERQEKRDHKKMEREIRRQQKQILRQIKRDQKKHEEDLAMLPIDPTRDCNSKNMKCFTHSNSHWKNAPFWDCEYVRSYFGISIIFRLTEVSYDMT
jgi:chorismate mutase